MFADGIVICSEVETYALEKRGRKVSQRKMEHVCERQGTMWLRGMEKSRGEDCRVNSAEQWRV